MISVEAFARTKGTKEYVYLPMNRIEGDSKAGTYTATIPAFLIEPAGVEYYIRVNDYGNNGFESKVYSIAVSNGVKPGYLQDFEADQLGFTTGGTGSIWSWGAPVSGPKAAYSGEKVIATNLQGTYLPNSNAYLLAPPIDLTESPEGALLTFKHWYDLENNLDFGKVYIASEDSDYVFEELLSYTGTSGEWKTQYVDLREYAGQQVFIQFNLNSDGTVQKSGWYIDDFAVQELDDIAPEAPSALSATADVLGNVTLNWTGSADEDLDSYVVYRSETAGSGYESVGTVKATSYTDTTTESNTTYYYTVAAVDYSGNESEKSNEVTITVEVPEDIYIDPFDGNNDNGWTHAGTKDEWERGIPLTGPLSTVSPPNVWATDLDNTYENGSNYSLISPVIDLKDVSEATLTFNHWYEIEGGYDFGYVEVTRDGGTTWTELGKFSHSTNGKKWTPVFYDLDALTGQEVQFRFRLTSDNSVVKTGWFLDDFRVLGVATDAVTENDAVVMASDKPKPNYDNPWYKVTRTDKAEFNKTKSQEPAVEKPATGAVEPLSLPASATVTVLETGRSVKTDSSTGKYSFTHVAGDYTLKAEAYGYYSQTKTVTISDGGGAKANFNLETIPTGQIKGVVKDERTGQPIADASVLVVEDAKVAEVHTGADGSFTLQVLEGSYTLSVRAADYYSNKVTVTVPGNGTVESTVTLKPFIGFPGEIAYDDGSAENARAFNAADNAWAVRMTPELETAQVTGASFRFWNTEWPVPGGTAFKYAVYDATGTGGAPGKMLAGPFEGTALRNDQWTSVEFPEPIIVTGDFYIVYIQSLAGTSAPGLATDENGTYAERSWQRVSGAWGPSPAEEGNYMIRAVVKYPVNAPVLTPPANTYTNQSTFTISGTSPASGAQIKFYNGKDAAGTTTVNDGKFSHGVKLRAGVNVITAEAIIDGKTTDRSLPVIIILDQTKPQLNIISPVEGSRINTEVVHVTGNVVEQFLDKLVVNGQKVQVDKERKFSHRVLVNEGENNITIEATDLAGNKTTVTRAVYVETGLPQITDITPAEDVVITSGESVDVSFKSKPGLQASFRIQLPLNLNAGGAGEVPLVETEPGLYTGTYTTPASLVLEGGVIVIRAQDAAGNKAEAQAVGRLFVRAAQQGEKEEQPAAEKEVQAGKDTESEPANSGGTPTES